MSSPAPAVPSSCAPSVETTCCRRPMTSIQVTSPLDAAVATLALHTCSSCGRHVWERDGETLDRAAVLAVVKDRVAEGPAPRVPRPRKPRASRARVVDLT